MAKAKATTIERVFELEKTTKNAVRYQEATEVGEAPIMRTLYLQKWALPGSPPERLKVAIMLDS